MLAFLLNYQVEPKTNKPYTHSSYNGKLWNIPNGKLDDFYTFYTEYILNELNPNDEYPSIVEHHTNMSCSPITVDIDIKQTIKNRQLDDDLLREIYDEFKEYLDEIFINDANYTCYMLMRNKPYFDQKSGFYKDGIHIYFPYVVTSYDFQFKLRHKMMTSLKDILKNIENKNSIENTYDEAVIKKNGMFLFMSTKPYTKPYKIYKIYNIDDELKEDNIKNILNILSLRNKTKMTEFKNEKIKKEYDVEINFTQPKIINKSNLDKNKSDNDESDDNDDDLEYNKNLDPLKDEVSYLLNILSDDHKLIYKNWLNIAFILKNSERYNDEFKELFLKWSDIDKYKNYYAENEKIWNNIKKKNDGLSIATLHDYAKKSSSIEYKKMISNKNKIREKEHKEDIIKNFITENKNKFPDECEMNINNIEFEKTKSIASLNDKFCAIHNAYHENGECSLILDIKKGLYQACLSGGQYPIEGIPISNNYMINIFGDVYIQLQNKIIQCKHNDEILIEDDMDAVEVVLKKIKNKVIKSNRRYFKKLYDDSNIYIEDLSPHFNDTKDFLLTEISNVKFSKLVGDKIKTYSRNASGARNILTLLMAHINDDKSFVGKMWNSNLYKLCFKNGYYDFKGSVFKNYDDNTYSPICIDYDFPERNEEKIQEVYDKILDPIFWDKEQQKYFLNWCARGIAGCYTDKTFSVGLGMRNSGKGVICELFKNSFQEYVGFFNPEEMICCRVGSGDIAKKMAWTIPFEFRRLNFSNELKIENERGGKIKLDGNIIKSISSGGDEKTARLNYKDEIHFKIQGRMMLMMNELVDISPADTYETMIVFKFQTEFKKNITDNDLNINKKGKYKFSKTDPNIKSILLNDNQIQKAFIRIILDHYVNYDPELPDFIIENKLNYINNSNQIIDFINYNFIITGNDGDYVSVNDVNDIIVKNSMNKSSVILKFDTLGVHQDKRNNVRCYMGLKKNCLLE